MPVKKQKPSNLDSNYGAIPGYGTDSITLDAANSMSYSITSPTWTTSTTGSYTIPTGTNYTYSTGAGIGGYGNVNITNTGIDMASGTDIKIGNKSLSEFMLKMEERLAILVPDPAKLEKFEALKKAYEHYKLMEKLCQEDKKED